MPEKEFPLRNNGAVEDSAQNKKHLSVLNADELKEALIDVWDSMDEIEYDFTQMDAYLEELEQREPVSAEFDPEASLVAFCEKHARIIEQILPEQLPTIAKPGRRHRWLSSLIAAVIAIVMMLGGMVTAQAFGIDVFGAIAEWTEDIFNYNIITQPSDSPDNTPTPATEGEFATAQDALDAYGITESVLPGWFPEGLRTNEVLVFPRATGITMQADYGVDEIAISISIRQFSSNEGAEISAGTFEKDSGSVTQYECNAITHYIMSNNSENVVTWVNNALICSISGNVSIDELKLMVNSIYEG